jgi:hypothetical protein
MRLQIARAGRAGTGGATRRIIGRGALGGYRGRFLCNLHRHVWRRSGEWLFHRNRRPTASRTGRPPNNTCSPGYPSRHQARALRTARPDRRPALRGDHASELAGVRLGDE